MNFQSNYFSDMAMVSSFSVIIRKFEQVSESTENGIIPNLIGKISINKVVHNKCNKELKKKGLAMIISPETAADRLKSLFKVCAKNVSHKKTWVFGFSHFMGKNLAEELTIITVLL